MTVRSFPLDESVTSKVPGDAAPLHGLAGSEVAEAEAFAAAPRHAASSMHASSNDAQRVARSARSAIVRCRSTTE